MTSIELDTGAPLRLGSQGIRTAHRTVTDRLRQAILAGELPGGTRLIQAELAESLQVSVTPVREALRDLASEGLVDFDAFRGAVVHAPTLDELDEVYELRRLLLPVAVRAGVENITDDELDQVTALAQAMRSEPDPTEWVHLNRQFHCLLDGAARRPRLQEILGRLADLSALYVGVSVGARKTRRQRADRDHVALASAYRKGDADTAVEISLRHLADTVEVARRALTSAG